jgi:hypothetical protein
MFPRATRRSGQVRRGRGLLNRLMEPWPEPCADEGEEPGFAGLLHAALNRSAWPNT